MTWLVRAAGAALVGAAVLTVPAQAERDRWITDIIRMAEDGAPEDGFCRRAPWSVAGNRAQIRFLDNATVGSAEAAKFNDGACSFTSVTRTYSGQYGKCVRYTWWACGPGKTCETGETDWCKDRDGSWAVGK